MARVSFKSVAVVSMWVVCLFTLYSFYPSHTYSGVTQIEANVSDPINVQRLSSKLEYINGKLMERSYEVHQLKDYVRQLSVTHDQDNPNHIHNDSNLIKLGDNMTDTILAVPNLFQLMPHLKNDVRATHPHRTFGLAKQGADMVLAVPHVHRAQEDYLIRTLSSLFSQMSAEEKRQTVIVVMVAEPFNESIFDMVSKEIGAQFSSEVEVGNLEVILPPAKWYPDLDNLPAKWGDKPDRAKWRTKQNLDYAFMMLYCSHIGQLYVQLEDDISAKPNYISQMKKYATSQDRWELLEFSQLGFIGKMFRTQMLPKFVSFILMFYKHKPVDWLLDNYFWVQECHAKTCSDLSKIRKRFRPSLFQHEGYHSSLAGKVQKLKDKDFSKKGESAKDPIIVAHENPEATLGTSLKVYQKYSLEKCYAGTSVFWALNPQPGDYIKIDFKTAVELKSYRVVSGDSQHKDDRLQNATIEFKPVSPSAKHPKDSFLLDKSGYVGFRYFNITALREPDDPVIYTIAEGTVPKDFGPISSVRILSHSESQNWVIISELWLAT